MNSPFLSQTLTRPQHSHVAHPKPQKVIVPYLYLCSHDLEHIAIFSLLSLSHVARLPLLSTNFQQGENLGVSMVHALLLVLIVVISDIHD